VLESSVMRTSKRPAFALVVALSNTIAGCGTEGGDAPAPPDDTSDVAPFDDPDASMPIGDAGASVDASTDAMAQPFSMPLATTLRGDYARVAVAKTGSIQLTGGAHYYLSGKYTVKKRDPSKSFMMAGNIQCFGAASVPVHLGTYSGGNFWETTAGAQKGLAFQTLFSPPVSGAYECYVVAWASEFPTCTSGCGVVFDVDTNPSKTVLSLAPGDQVGASEWTDSAPPPHGNGCVYPGEKEDLVHGLFVADPNAKTAWVDSGLFLTEDHNPNPSDHTPCNLHTSAASTVVNVSLLVTQVDAKGAACAPIQSKVISAYSIVPAQHHIKVFPSLTSITIDHEKCLQPARFAVTTRLAVVSGNDVWVGNEHYTSTIARNNF